MTEIAQCIAAAQSVVITDIGFCWNTGLTKDNTIVVANNYALGYIPDNVHLSEQVKLAAARRDHRTHPYCSWKLPPRGVLLLR